MTRATYPASMAGRAYVYRCEHRPSGRFYIGARRLLAGMTPTDDGAYLGSGRAWGKLVGSVPLAEIEKRILSVHDCRAEAGRREAELLKDAIGDPLCMNRTIAARVRFNGGLPADPLREILGVELWRKVVAVAEGRGVSPENMVRVAVASDALALPPANPPRSRQREVRAERRRKAWKADLVSNSPTKRRWAEVQLRAATETAGMTRAERRSFNQRRWAMGGAKDEAAT